MDLLDSGAPTGPSPGSTTIAVHEIYTDGRYLDAHPTWHAERGPWKAAHVATGLRAAGLTPARVCDIGCGTGRVLAQLRRLVPSVSEAVGFEPSADAPVHPECEGVVEVRRSEAAAAEERFDVALMLDVFEHIPDYIAFLRSVHHLAPHFVFHVPLEVNALTVLSGRLGETRRLHGHLHHFTRRTTLDALRDAGYRPVHDHFTKVGWEGEGKRPWSKAAVVRRAVHALSPTLAERLTGGLSLLVVAAAE